MKDWMDVHRCEKVESISLEADSLNDDKGADAFPVELLTGAFDT